MTEPKRDPRKTLKVILDRYPKWQDGVVVESLVTIHGSDAKPDQLTIGQLRRLCDAAD